MPIKEIIQTINNNIPSQKPIKEVMDIDVPNIPDGISKRNGMVYVLTGSGGSGKTSLLLNFFKSKELYRNKFDNIYYICPNSSFLSVANHPFEEHDKIFHELTDGLLYEIYNQLAENKEKRLKKKKKPYYSLIIIDDMADTLKEKHIQIALNKMIIKARHLCCGFIFTLQSYLYFPKILRKQITFVTIFKPKNIEEWYSIARELLNMNQDDALKLFHFVYDEPYKHLDVDTVTNKYYSNFNYLEIKSTHDK
jgi:hypothetical protein